MCFLVVGVVFVLADGGIAQVSVDCGVFQLGDSERGVKDIMIRCSERPEISVTCDLMQLFQGELCTHWMRDPDGRCIDSSGAKENRGVERLVVFESGYLRD